MRAVQMRARPELISGALRALHRMGRVERAEGTLLSTLARARQHGPFCFTRDWTFAELLEWAALHHHDKPFLDYGDAIISFAALNRRANRTAVVLREAGIGAGTGCGLFMSNHPRFLEVFFALQKLGAYAVPMHTELVGDGLAYILSHSRVRGVVCGHETFPKLSQAAAALGSGLQLWLHDDEAPHDYVRPAGALTLPSRSELEWASDPNPGLACDPQAPSLLSYTSGTTGLPKAVVTPYGQQRIKSIGLLAHLLYHERDKLYTCLPLFHANALLLTIMSALWVGIPVRLAKRFSASTFFRELAQCGATQLNTVGSMIPVLLKTAAGPWDRAHRVRRVISAACPKDSWRAFEQRFGVRIWEAYGAVDGAGMTIINPGTGPVGSIGRLPRRSAWRLVDDMGRDVENGQAGELWLRLPQSTKPSVPYWNDEQATRAKVSDGWLHTGDLMQADREGYLYFVGRNTDSMRRRGENVSAFELERVVDAHPDVLESAAFGVPSALGEQDIMLSVVPVPGRTLDPRALCAYLATRLPRHAQPSYLDIVDELPKTATHRVIKGRLKERGVSATTLRLEELRAAC